MNIVLVLFLYLILGSVSLSYALWHDRRCEDSFDKWVDDDMIAGLIVMFFPFFWLCVIANFLFFIFPVKFAHFMMAIPVTIVYVVKALINKEDNNAKDSD